MERKELSATSWFKTRIVVVLLLTAGALFAFAPEFLVSMLGTERRVLGAVIFVLFAATAFLYWENVKLRVHTSELMEALHQLLYGKDYRRDREAIDILLASLESTEPVTAKTAYDHLIRLTGQNFAQDPKVWRSWWEANRKTFERKR